MRISVAVFAILVSCCCGCYIQAALPRNGVMHSLSDENRGARVRASTPPIFSGDGWYNHSSVSSTHLDVPPRKMWGWEPGSLGYSGETSFQAALLYYGNWLSAQWIRYAAGGKEVLVGKNDKTVAENLHLKYETWNQRQPADSFLQEFVKPQILSGAPVAVGVYKLTAAPYSNNDYDMIILITGVDLDASGEVVGVYFNDWWETTAARYSGRHYQNGSSNPYFIASRSGCLSQKPPSRPPLTYCLPATLQFAIAFQGMQKALVSNAITTRLRADKPWEPDWSGCDALHEEPVLQKFDLHISGLTSGAEYQIFRFNGPEAFIAAPAADPAKGSYTWRYRFTAVNSTLSLLGVVSLMSDLRFYFVVSKCSLVSKSNAV